MELSPGRQRLLFVVVVIGLVALGIFVIRGRNDGNAAAPAATPTPTPTHSATATSGPVTGAPAPASSPPASLAGASPSAAAGSANIYQWLPFTQSDLTAAAKTTLAFAADYVTWNSKESKAAYGAKMAGLVTAQEDATLEYDFGTAARAAGNAVSTGSGTIDSISSFGSNPASITFSVTIAQQVVPAKGTSTSPSTYSVTAVSTGAGWRVNNIELSSLGNE
jgi:hypothetical protein